MQKCKSLFTFLAKQKCYHYNYKQVEKNKKGFYFSILWLIIFPDTKIRISEQHNFYILTAKLMVKDYA